MTPVASVSLSPVREGKKSPVKSNVTPVKSDVSSAKVDIKSDSNKDCGEGIGGGNPNEDSSVQRAQIKSPPRDTNNANYYEEEDDELQSSEASYEAEFNQPQHVKDEMYKREKNTMRSPTEGKACLDRYRLASSRIFSLIEEVRVLVVQHAFKLYSFFLSYNLSLGIHHHRL